MARRGHGSASFGDKLGEMRQVEVVQACFLFWVQTMWLLKSKEISLGENGRVLVDIAVAIAKMPNNEKVI